MTYVGLHQRGLAARENSLHRTQQVSCAARTAARCSSCFAFVDLETLQPHAFQAMWSVGPREVDLSDRREYRTCEQNQEFADESLAKLCPRRTKTRRLRSYKSVQTLIASCALVPTRGIGRTTSPKTISTSINTLGLS